MKGQYALINWKFCNKVAEMRPNLRAVSLYYTYSGTEEKRRDTIWKYFRS
jgi:hypothetical protein